MAEKFRSNVQRNTQILAEEIRQLPESQNATRALKNRPYSHFFHLKIQYGTIAAISISTSAYG